MKPLRTMPVLALVSVCVMASLAGTAQAFTREAAPYQGDGLAPALAGSDCLLTAYNLCSCWVWIFNEQEGSVYGKVFDVNDCAASCPTGAMRAVRDVWFYSDCFGGTPAVLNNISIQTIDASRCLTGALYDTGPVSVFACTGSSRWTHIVLPDIDLTDDAFAVTLEWGPSSPAQVRLVTDNALGNLFCSMGLSGFPGCLGTVCGCASWAPTAENSYIYLTDFTGDTIPDDLCGLYGAPYPLNFPYYPSYGYLGNNLLVSVGLTCSAASSVKDVSGESQPTSWGRVKALYR